VPAAAVVEELAAARAQEREDVLEVRGGARRGTERRRIERAAPRGEEDEARETAGDLEAARADVLVRQAVAARWRIGPRRSAASREPLAAPAAAPVATWAATITAAVLADGRARRGPTRPHAPGAFVLSPEG